MSTWKKIVLALVILASIVLIVVFWGSIFSICMIMGLVSAPGVYLYNRFLNTDEKSDFTEDV